MTISAVIFEPFLKDFAASLDASVLLFAVLAAFLLRAAPCHRLLKPAVGDVNRWGRRRI